MSDAPRIERVRHELKRRTLSVSRVEKIAPQMVRVMLSGDELRGFTSLGFDDHIKLFFAPTVGDDTAQSEMRDFTPRRYDAQTNTLTIDFFLHASGPAATWAAQATAGQSLLIAGPRGSAVISLEGIDAHVLIGDETALPAISRRLEELPAEARALVVFEHDAGSTWPALESRAKLDVISVARDGTIDPPAHAVIAALRNLAFPAGDSFVWVGVESRAARAIRRYLREERNIDKRWIKAAGYWQRGTVGSHDKTADEE